jgi:2',3'-cyclic-nucleotide 2'-phosphodiesterase / 3'-nucleotidase
MAVNITLLSTTDSRGHIEPCDYYTNKPANLGLAKIATLVKQARVAAPDALLLDCGDTTQGTPLAFKQIYTKGVPYIRPDIIKTLRGVRIGIVGFVTPGIPRWEIPAHYKGYEFLPIVESARTIIPEVRKQVDLLVVIMHPGLDRDPRTGEHLPTNWTTKTRHGSRRSRSRIST